MRHDHIHLTLSYLVGFMRCGKGKVMMSWTDSVLRQVLRKWRLCGCCGFFCTYDPFRSVLSLFPHKTCSIKCSFKVFTGSVCDTVLNVDSCDWSKSGLGTVVILYEVFAPYVSLTLLSPLLEGIWHLNFPYGPLWKPYMTNLRIFPHTMIIPSDICFLIAFFDSCPGSLHVGTTAGISFIFYHTTVFSFCTNLKFLGIRWGRK